MRSRARARRLRRWPLAQAAQSPAILLMALLVVAVGVVAPFAWSYLQSYESTDDAQIDGHIDPLSSRIDGTVIRVHAEDDDRVKAGELLVEIDPRDYEVAVGAGKGAAGAGDGAGRVPRSRTMPPQLAKVREERGGEFQGAKRRATVRDPARPAGGARRTNTINIPRLPGSMRRKLIPTGKRRAPPLKAIAAREADVDAAKAALDQALLNLSYTKIYAPANGIVGKRGVQLGSRIQPGQTLMFVTETDDIWVTANFKETQLARMHRGQKVTIHVDTFGRNYRGYVEESARRERRSLQPASARERDRQLREGGAAPAGQNPSSTPARIPSICCIPECRWSPRYGCVSDANQRSKRAAAPAQFATAARAHNPWAIALTVTMATFMELLDTSISNVSLPHIAGGLGTSYDESTWVLTSYLVANAIILPMSAWLSRVFGRKRYYMMCVALFTVTSLLCGLAPSLGMLIFFRVLPGNRRRRSGAGRTGDPGRHLSHGETGRRVRALQYGDRHGAGYRTAAGRMDHG